MPVYVRKPGESYGAMVANMTEMANRTGEEVTGTFCGSTVKVQPQDEDGRNFVPEGGSGPEGAMGPCLS